MWYICPVPHHNQNVARVCCTGESCGTPVPVSHIVHLFQSRWQVVPGHHQATHHKQNAAWAEVMARASGQLGGQLDGQLGGQLVMLCLTQ